MTTADDNLTPDDLTRLEGLLREATPRTWLVEDFNHVCEDRRGSARGIAKTAFPHDAALIVAAVNNLPALIALARVNVCEHQNADYLRMMRERDDLVRAVEGVHSEREWRPLDGTYLGGTVCDHCRRSWPCSTIRALDQATVRDGGAGESGPEAAGTEHDQLRGDV